MGLGSGEAGIPFMEAAARLDPYETTFSIHRINATKPFPDGPDLATAIALARTVAGNLSLFSPRCSFAVAF